MTVTTRNVGIGHAIFIAEFVHDLLYELSNGDGPDLETVTSSVHSVLQNDLVTSVAAYDCETPVGLMMLNECAAIYAGGKFGEISELYVLPAYRSKGVATKLIEAAVVEGRTRGWKRLEVGAPSQPAWMRTLQFYLQNGFDEVGPRLRKLI